MRRGERIAPADRAGAGGPRAARRRARRQAREEPPARRLHDRAAGDGDNELSDRFTVIEVECLDRHGLLYDLTHAMSELSLDIASAHIATFGERVVDTFYVTDLVGHKVTRQGAADAHQAGSAGRDRDRGSGATRRSSSGLVSLVRQFVSVGGATLASRLFGFVRETMIASALGAGPVADAFYAAFRFPNLFRRLFAEGAFNAAFIPLFARTLEGEGEEAARKFAEDVLAALVLVLGALTALVMIATPLHRDADRAGLHAATRASST